MDMKRFDPYDILSPIGSVGLAKSTRRSTRGSIAQSRSRFRHLLIPSWRRACRWN